MSSRIDDLVKHIEKQLNKLEHGELSLEDLERELGQLMKPGAIISVDSGPPLSLWDAGDGAEIVQFLAGLRVEVSEIRKEKTRKTKGGTTRGAQKTVEAANVKRWLYPLLHAEYGELENVRIDKGGKRSPGWQKLRDNVVNLQMKTQDKRRKLVTESRVREWIKAGRPKSFDP